MAGMTTILITGGAGFIGSHLVEYIIENTDWHIIILDKLNYASQGFTRLKEIGVLDHFRVQLFVVDIAHPLGQCLEKEIGHVDYFVHIAAESHVDNSILIPRQFIEANMFGTYEMLEFSRRIPGLSKFLYFSTDEVFGSAEPGMSFEEWDRYNSGSPYSATKAAGEELTLAYRNSYAVPCIITHTCNVFGERQHPEKFIPKAIRQIHNNMPMDIHTNSAGVPGSRTYIHAQDVAAATLFVLRKGAVGEKYNISSGKEFSNLEIARKVGAILGRTVDAKYIDPSSIRPGNDFRYSLSGERLAALGWKVPDNFDAHLKRTVLWSVRKEHIHWLGGK